MKYMYNRTGTERRALVNALSEVVGWPAVYKGAPTFEYAVSDYIIDKHGTLIIPVDTDYGVIESVLDQLALKGFVHEACEEDEPEYEADEPEVASVEVIEPILEDAPESSELPEHAMGSGIESEAISQFVIEMPLAGFTDTQLLNLHKLVASKASLIMKSLGVTALPIEITEDRLAFPWFDRELTSLEIETYTHFIAALCDTARTQKRVVARDKEVASERFAFRIFLLKLGFAGKEYHEQRNLLYTRLTGDCAFSNAGKRDEHAARWKDVRRQRRAQSVNEAPENYTEDCQDESAKGIPA